MANLMRFFGVLLLAAAVAIIVLLKLMSAQMQVLGIAPETAAILLVGGVLSLGLGGVISALANRGSVASSAIKQVPVTVATVEEEPSSALPKMDFGKKPSAPAQQPQAAAAKPVAANSVADTIAALEQAKSDIKTALGGVERMTAPDEPPIPAYVSPPPPPPPQSEAEQLADGELFVVEEKIIRGRPSRILSDDTVEAETDEGWMRFENLEHLNEYLDSLEEGDA